MENNIKTVLRVKKSFRVLYKPVNYSVIGDQPSFRFSYRSEMAGGRVAHATLKGPSVVKEIVIGITLGLCAGGLWKMHHWNEQRKVRSFYDMLEKGEISVVAEE
ncbi:hypothetical protein V6N13_131919 [Hibiscus sabdariffa]|uniref:Cytochrome c oxidase subunit 5C n=1 Tax=Hibiscus sabdariffa TaxID=183260 RepID=A0ABR2D9C0_9ROSI